VTDGAKLSLEIHDWNFSSMPVLSTIVSPEQQESRPAASNQEERWYAAYTCANHEKRVAAQLRDRSIEHLLPLYSSTRRWKDRRVLVEFPLFPGYVFVRLALCDRLRILQIPSLVRLVGFGGQPCALPEEDIHAIQKCLDRGYQVEPHPYLQVGRRARVKTGALQGLEGIILRRKNRTRFILSLELIMRSVAVEIDGIELESVAAVTC
jgi:transcription antitermination factor NusG